MIASYLPDTSIGTSGNGAHFTTAFGRGNLIAQHQSEAHEKSFLAGQHTHASGLAAMLGTWMRRRTEWKFQAEQAERELATGGGRAVHQRELHVDVVDEQDASETDRRRQLRGAARYRRRSIRVQLQSIQSVATSSGQNDSGLFELNFRDERYLPFEGAGAVSRWRFELPRDTNVFDFETISDVVLHLRYTAREGGVMLRKAGRETLAAIMADTNILAQSRLVSLRHEFPTEWARFSSPTDATALKQKLIVDPPMERFPFRFRGWQMHIREVEVLMPLRDFRDANGLPVNALNEYRGKPLDVGLSFLAPNGTVVVSTVGTLATSRGVLGGTPYLHWTFAPQDVPVRLRLEVTENAVKQLKPSLQVPVPPPTGRKRLKSDAIEDVIVILHFNAER